MIDAFKGKIFDYLTLWDKLFTLLMLNNKYEQLRDLIRYIQKNIGKIKYVPMKGNSYVFTINEAKESDVVKSSLMKYLYYNLNRVFSLKYNSDVKMIIEDIREDFPLEMEINFTNQISNCLYASMQNNSFMKYPLQDLSYIYDDFDGSTSFDLVNQRNKCIKLFEGFCYPRFIKLHECILHTINNELFCENEEEDLINSIISLKDQNLLAIDLDEVFDKMGIGDYLKKSVKFYEKENFDNDLDMYGNYIKRECGLNCMGDAHCPIEIYNESEFKDVNIIKIKDRKKNKIKVGLLNTNIDYNDFENRILGKPNLTSKRFDKIKLLINEAIRKNVNLLVMPEMYIPYEWIDNIVKIAKDYQMAIIFGIEPLEINDEIGNYMMMALPFIFNDKYHECALMYRAKNHYSPEEIRQFEKYEMKIKNEDKSISKYYMCIWNDIHIVPYCSYEIASIDDRSIFKSCCDIVTVSEFNKDAKYINNIVESLSRDLFCYCIKSNITEYGGSCIIQPTSSMINI